MPKQVKRKPPPGRERGLSKSAKNAKRRAEQRVQRKLETESLCGAQKRNGKPCLREAGWGTDHPGQGRCKHHAGSTLSGKMSATRTEAEKLATPVPTTPSEALQHAMDLTYGQLIYASQRVAQLEEEQVFVNSISGKIPHHWIRFQRQLTKELADYAKVAANVGIAERRTALQEAEADMVGRYLEAVLGELGLSEEQRKLLGPAMRRHLTLVQGDQPEEVIEGTAEEVAA